MSFASRIPERVVARFWAAVPREEDFTSPLRGPAVAARVGVWLAACFGIAFVTGLISHLAQATDPLIPLPTRPVWGYRVTQGLHVAAGTAAIPLLLVKLWTVFPRLFTRPPAPSRALVLHALERISIAVLVGSSLFLLATGTMNAAQWYPWAFSFRATHYAMAWVAIGALLVHVAVKLAVLRQELGTPLEEGDQDSSGLSRRGLVRTSVLAAGVAVLATAGSTVPALRKISVFGVRSGDGPAGIPINKSARAADVVATALDPDFALAVVLDDGSTRTFDRAALLALPQTTATLPIACVEGWSASGDWTGVRVRDLLEAAGQAPGTDLRIESLQPRGPFRSTLLPARFADDPLTLLALRLNGEVLALDHGYPCRLIAPNRPGVLQTKWVSRIEVLR